MQVDCFDIKALTNLLKEQSVQEPFNSPRLQDFESKQTPETDNITEKDDPISNDLIRECNNTDVSEIGTEKIERLCQIEELMKRIEAFEIEKSTHLSQIDDLKDTLQNEVDHRKNLENKLEAKEAYTQEENTGLIETRVSDESVNRQIQTNDELRQENDHLNEVINKLQQDLNFLNNEKKCMHEENSDLIKDKALDESLTRHLQTNGELRQENAHLNEVINELRQGMTTLNHEKDEYLQKIEKGKSIRLEEIEKYQDHDQLTEKINDLKEDLHKQVTANTFRFS
jgi:chromosome segregation ATPase